jgi:hypothetical protein
MMYPSNNDMKDNVNVDNNIQMRQTNTSPAISNSSQPSSPSCSTLLVIDDTSNSEDSTTNNTNNIPIKPMSSITTQISHIQIPTTLSPSVLDIANGTVEQQRRRNSSIAKLLGGHPLHNQQYEEINQQILDDQSAQNLTNNNDNGTDNGIQRTRSSITRTLLMNTERTNSMTKLPSKPQTVTSPAFSKDFEYLIRREVDNEHAVSALQRNNSAPKSIQNLNSSNNTNAQLPKQSKLKRKRPISKSPLATSNIPPFSLHDPFELESAAATNSIPSVNHSQNKFLNIDLSKRPRHSNQQQYQLPTNQSSYSYPKTNISSSLYNHFTIPQDRVSSNNCSSSCNCPHYTHSTKLTLPSLVTHLSSSATKPNNNSGVPITATRKAKCFEIFMKKKTNN